MSIFGALLRDVTKVATKPYIYLAPTSRESHLDNVQSSRTKPWPVVSKAPFTHCGGQHVSLVQAGPGRSSLTRGYRHTSSWVVPHTGGRDPCVPGRRCEAEILWASARVSASLDCSGSHACSTKRALGDVMRRWAMMPHNSKPPLPNHVRFAWVEEWRFVGKCGGRAYNQLLVDNDQRRPGPWTTCSEESVQAEFKCI